MLRVERGVSVSGDEDSSVTHAPAGTAGHTGEATPGHTPQAPKKMDSKGGLGRGSMEQSQSGKGRKSPTP